LAATVTATPIALPVLVPPLPTPPPVCLAAALALPTLPRPVPAQALLSAVPRSAILHPILACPHALLRLPRATTLLDAIAKAMVSALLALVIPLELICAHPTVLAQPTCLILVNAQAQVNVHPFSVIQYLTLASPPALFQAPQHTQLVAIVKVIVSVLPARVIPLELICAHPTVLARATSPILVSAPAHLSATPYSVTLLPTLACHLAQSRSQLVHIPLDASVREILIV
jgi:hypothetical protein